MIGYVGIPGESKHRWRRFESKKEAEKWAKEAWEEARGDSPQWCGPYGTLSEKAASLVRYRDGNRVYPRAPQEAFAAGEEEPRCPASHPGGSGEMGPRTEAEIERDRDEMEADNAAIEAERIEDEEALEGERLDLAAD